MRIRRGGTWTVGRPQASSAGTVLLTLYLQVSFLPASDAVAGMARMATRKEGLVLGFPRREQVEVNNVLQGPPPH